MESKLILIFNSLAYILIFKQPTPDININSKKYKQYSFLQKILTILSTNSLYPHILPIMHQISLQQLSHHIPKLLQNWQTQDIYKWLTLNNVEVDKQKLENNKINGKNINKLTPNNWICQYQMTRYIAKQIVQWIQEQSQQFDQLVKANIQGKQHKQGREKQIKCQRSYSYNQDNDGENFSDFWNKPKSCQNLDYPIINPIFHKNISNKSQENLSKSNQINQPSNFSSSSSSSSSQNSIKSQGEIEQPQQKKDEQIPSKQIVNQMVFSQVTQRIQKKIKNANSEMINNKQHINVNNKIVQQPQIIENQSISVSKWIKKKNDDTKFFNQRLKLKNKQIFRSNPKLYNYLNQNFVQNLPQAQSKNAIVNKKQQVKIEKMQKKAVSPVHLIPKLYSSPSTAINSSASPNLIPTSPLNPNPVPTIFSSAHSPTPTPTPLDHPMVKFASSEFIPYTPQSQSQHQSQINNYRPQRDSRLREKSIKVTSQNYQKTIKGHAKIGRFKQNDIVLFDQTVSRNHAEIVPFIQINGKIQYCIKDVGSKFGTFVQCKGNIQGDIVGKSYLIGDVQIQILSAEPSKLIYPNSNNNISNNNNSNINNINLHNNNNPNNINKKQTFDIKILIDRQKQQIFTNRVSLSIGKRIGNDIRIQNNLMTAKIYMDNKQRRFYLEGSNQGKLYSKIKQHELLNIEEHMDNNNKLDMVFGWLRATFQVIEICILCGKKIGECYCLGDYEENNQVEKSKEKEKDKQRKVGKV